MEGDPPEGGPGLGLVLAQEQIEVGKAGLPQGHLAPVHGFDPLVVRPDEFIRPGVVEPPPFAPGLDDGKVEGVVAELAPPSGQPGADLVAVALEGDLAGLVSPPLLPPEEGLGQVGGVGEADVGYPPREAGGRGFTGLVVWPVVVALLESPQRALSSSRVWAGRDVVDAELGQDAALEDGFLEAVEEAGEVLGPGRGAVGDEAGIVVREGDEVGPALPSGVLGVGQMRAIPVVRLPLGVGVVVLVAAEGALGALSRRLVLPSGPGVSTGWIA